MYSVLEVALGQTVWAYRGVPPQKIGDAGILPLGMVGVADALPAGFTSRIWLKQYCLLYKRTTEICQKMDPSRYAFQCHSRSSEPTQINRLHISDP